ncbi:hypothetical protein BS47DRAFT_1337089 [Hydnum rufescens UP504]|uniref:Uncharacterized protein n=1 Tax=Hydnum rufescens UP504 TaxID=1448309 RepID=A0A9P6BAL6_9AGAM|nr:hypothetical protein BS47DRAFT_1337089 [Hydnum rufescens UP504]
MAMHVCRLFESSRRLPWTPNSSSQWNSIRSTPRYTVPVTRPQAGTLLEVYDWKRGQFRAHFVCSVKTDSFCFIAENLIILPHYPEDAQDAGEGIVVARFQFPGQGSSPRPAIRVFGFASPRPNAPFIASRRVRIVCDDSSVGLSRSFWPIEVLMDPLSFLSFTPSTRSSTPSLNTVSWDRWGVEAQLIPEMKYRYGVKRVHPTRTAHLEIDQPPSLTGDRALVMGVRVVEFGRRGLSARHTKTARTAMAATEDKNTAVSYYPLPKPLLGNTVAHLTNTLQVSRPLHEFYVREYRILSDEERIVVLERPYASDPNDGVERRWSGSQTLTVFTV